MIDIVVQLLICFICWSMGSSLQLRKYEMLLIRDINGVMQLHFKLKDTEHESGVSIISSHASSIVSDSSFVQ